MSSLPTGNCKLGHDCQRVGGCILAADTSQLVFVVGKFVQTRRDSRQLVANSVHTADVTQLDSYVVLASVVCIGQGFKRQWGMLSYAVKSVHSNTRCGVMVQGQEWCTNSAWGTALSLTASLQPVRLLKLLRLLTVLTVVMVQISSGQLSPYLLNVSQNTLQQMHSVCGLVMYWPKGGDATA